MLKLCFPLIFWLLSAFPSFSHELWIEPEEFQVETGSGIIAHMRNGQGFAGGSLPYATRSIVRLEVQSNGEFTTIEGRLGDRPAISLTDVVGGLAVIGYESKPAFLRYDSWEIFENFTMHKDLGDPLERHLARGLSKEDVREGYTRFSKTLVGVGAGNGLDQRFGFEAEIVALENPYTSPDSFFPVQLFYLNAPLSDYQIEVFDRSTDGQVLTSTVRTDENGIAAIPTKAGHVYMLDSVIFREPSSALLEYMDVQWETLWANLTFARPD